MWLRHFLRRFICKGTLRVVTAAGRLDSFGVGHPCVTIKLHNRLLEWGLVLNPELKIPEAYMQGTLTIESGSLRDFLYLLGTNFQSIRRQRLYRWMYYIANFRVWSGQFNPLGRARRNAAFHYDLPSELYAMFLDSDRQYSCAYFSDWGLSLEQAQYDKKRHIAGKLLLRRGLRVLDIGSGWGGLDLYIAREFGCDVTGVTLSVEQHKISRQRAQAAGLSSLCHFELRDYRQKAGRYDRIVSVGMFEHVGKKNYDEFFATIRDHLTDEGVCLLHAIGRLGEPQPVNPFIRKYIFPGGDLASLSEVTRAIERAGLLTTDIEILRLHYAETLSRWHDRFQEKRARAVALFGETFCRKWEMYLRGAEMSFRYQGLMVFQIQLSKRLETVPFTRDYMYEHEQAAPTFLSCREENGGVPT